MNRLNDIVIISSDDFDTLWYQRQVLALLFAKAGHRVFYFNKTPQRWSGPAQITKWLIKRTKDTKQNRLSENLRIVNPLWLAPVEFLRCLNRKLIRQTLKKLDIKNVILITDVPSYNTLDAIEQIQPEKIVYINVHNYDDSDGIARTIFDSEKSLIQQADFLFADSLHNAERLKQKSSGREVLCGTIYNTTDIDRQKRFETFYNTIFSESKTLPKFSILMSVYQKDKPEYFRDAMESVLNQTVRPDEIVLVKDGPVNEELEKIINEYEQKTNSLLKIVSFKENKGLGAALAEGIKKCSFDIVARMDADDLSSPQRFEKQLKFLKDNPSIDVVSCFAAAFDENVEKPLFVRRGPLLHEQIAKQFRFRFCMNHPASMFRKNAVLKAGNYPAMARLQDYHLWARMILKGAKMATIGQVLYYHRWEKQLLKRRSGFKRASLQIKLQKELLKIGFINKPQFLRNVLIRSIATILPQGLTRRLRIIFGI